MAPHAAQSSLKFHTWCCVLLTTLSAMLMGYDVGIISGAILFITEEMKLTVIQEEMIVGSLNIVAALGAAVAGFFANWFGRRGTLNFAAFVFFTGALVLAFSPNFSSLMVGRVLTGTGVGFAMMIAPLYSAEISPAKVRGFLVSFTEIFVDVGIVLGYIAGFSFQFLDPRYNWRVMLGVGAIPAIALSLGTIFVLPESPRWLVMRGHNDEALHVLEKTMRSEGDGSATQKRLDEIIAANELERNTGFRWKNLTSGSFSQLCSSPDFKALAKMYAVAIGINFFQQAAGIEATVYYSPLIFKVGGVTSRLSMLGATMCVGVVKLGFVLVATFTLDKVGRRKLLLLSSIGMTLCLIAICVTFIMLGIDLDPSVVMVHMTNHIVADPTKITTSVASAVVTVVAICAYVAFFSMGWGPIAYVFSSEVFPPSHRSKALGWSMLVNRAVSGAVALTFLTISQSITLTGTFGLFGIITLLSIVFTVFVVPETKGKSLEELGQGTPKMDDPSTSDMEAPFLS